jgi:anti-anti-sigma factor
VQAPPHFIVGRVQDVEAEIREELAQGRAVIMLDMGNCEYVDTAALGLVLRMAAECRKAGGELLVADPPEMAYQLMELVGLEEKCFVRRGERKRDA